MVVIVSHFKKHLEGLFFGCRQSTSTWQNVIFRKLMAVLVFKIMLSQLVHFSLFLYSTFHFLMKNPKKLVGFFLRKAKN